MQLIGMSCRNPPAFIGKMKPVLQDEVAPRSGRRILRGLIRGTIALWPAPEEMPPHGSLLLYTQAATACTSGVLPPFSTVAAMNPERTWHPAFWNGINGHVTVAEHWRALSAILDPIAAHAIERWRTERNDARTLQTVRGYARCVARELMALEALSDERTFELYAMLYQAGPRAAEPAIEAEIRFRYGYRAPQVMELAKKPPECA